jgi:hypothetical protein
MNPANAYGTAAARPARTPTSTSPLLPLSRLSDLRTLDAARELGLSSKRQHSFHETTTFLGRLNDFLFSYTDFTTAEHMGDILMEARMMNC